MLAAGYDLWKFVSEYHDELLAGLENTLKVSAIASAETLSVFTSPCRSSAWYSETNFQRS